MRKMLFFPTAAAFAFGLGLCAHAAVEESTLGVTATVIAQCTVTTTAIDFGEISPTQAASASGAIAISCDADNTLDSVTLDGGDNESSGDRRMDQGGTDFIPYTLTVGGSSVAVDGDIVGDFTLTGSGPYSDSVDVDGAIASVSAPGRATGTYTDSITVTVTYSAPTP